MEGSEGGPAGEVARAPEPGRPLERGTRSRLAWELEFSRIVAFSDGVFAIAITLLVLTLTVPPDSPDPTGELLSEWPDLLAYVLSFALIGRLWLLHHRVFSEVTHFDGRLIAINLLYLGLIALIPFTTEVLGEYGNDPAGVVPYALNVGLTNLVGSWMVLYAVRHGLTRPGLEWIAEHPWRWRGFAAAAIFLASLPVAFFSPLAAELLWVTLFLTGVRESIGARPARS
jgi:uncharacterized membrane protein